MRRRIKRKRGPVQSKKIVKDGITFEANRATIVIIEIILSALKPTKTNKEPMKIIDN